MSKLVYLLWKAVDLEGPSFRGRLIEELAPRLLGAGAERLSVNVADVEASMEASVPVRAEEGEVAGLVTLSLPNAEKREEIERALGAVSEKIAGYRVTESIPLEYDRRTWPDGERSPGAKLVTLFHKPAEMPYDAFIREWHEVHTPLSLQIHPLWRYIRNVVEESVTVGAPHFDGIVEEHFRSVEDITDPDRFYGKRENIKR